MSDMNEHTAQRINDYPNFLECSIQTFNDRDKEDKKYSRIRDITDEHLQNCIQLQEKYPYWIFFSVNPMEKWKRNMDSVKSIQTWICDIDDWDKEKQLELIKNAPLKPSLVVESNHWFHLYYLADRDLTKEEYENWNRGLKNYYWGDPKVCKDVARVLRIPWYYHMKWEPYLVKYRTDLGTKDRYSYDLITEKFPNQQDTTPWKVKQREAYNREYNDKSTFRSKAKLLNSRSMLEELSWTGWLHWDVITFKRNSNGTEQIYCNGKSTSCWIDTKDEIWSSEHWWPYWTEWLKWYGTVDRKELAKYLKDKHPELEEKERRPILDTQIVEKVEVAPKLEKPDFTWWTELLDDNIWKLSKGQFVILCWETGKGKTTFANFMARKNPTSCYYVLEDTVENIARRYATRYSWITLEEYNKWQRSEEKQQRYERAYKSMLNGKAKMIDIGWKIEIDELLEHMKKMKDKWYDLFFIDNLGFIIWEWENEERQTAGISAKLVSFCLHENVCVVLLHHFKKRQNQLVERDIGQMRWSWKLGDDATFVLEYFREWNETYLNVMKDRTWWRTWEYEISYNKGDFEFIRISNRWSPT